MTEGKRSKWRTYKVLAHTLAASSDVVWHSLLGNLDAHMTQKIIQRWVRKIFATAHIELEVFGGEYLRADQQVLFLSNHVSLLDVPSVFKAAPGAVRAISKQELRSVPVFGRALADAGVIFVDRKDTNRAKEQLNEGKKKLRENQMSLWVAAEGTRSRDGRLLPFKKGGFHVAQQLGLPIVPTWISGTLDVLPPDQWESITCQKVSVSFGKPILTEGKTVADVGSLMRETRTVMLELARQVGDVNVDSQVSL